LATPALKTEALARFVTTKMTTPNPFDNGLFWCEGCQVFDQRRYLREHDGCFDNDEDDNNNNNEENENDE
jgi:hypothetical protein